MMSGIRYNGVQTAIYEVNDGASGYIDTMLDADTAAPIGCLKTNMRPLERLPDAEGYEIAAYFVYGALSGQQSGGREVRRCELERGIALYAARES